MAHVKPADGWYEGGDDQLAVDLRLDQEGAGVISADVHRSDGGYVASVRTAPSVRVSLDEGRWPAVWQDSLGDSCAGSLALAGNGDQQTVTATLRLDKRLNMLPPGTDIVVRLRRAGTDLRRLGVEVEIEDGVRMPAPVKFGDTDVTWQQCLAKAGITVHDVGESTTIPAQPAGWNASTIFTLLHDVMETAAQAPLGTAAWDLHLLMLSKTTRNGLFGIMFDAADELPRQGAAVFVSDIRKHVPNETDRKIIQTTVHELGHALNLAHRFERAVGRADSTSFMNYDWRYLGGGKAEEFWNAFDFLFDPDELEFLRHAPRNALIPGGASFRSVNYWADGTGGYSPYVPEVPVPGFRLTLTPPAAGPIFAFGQPVFLEVQLQNQRPNPIELPPGVLDPKTGFLEVLIRRRSGILPTGLRDAVPFVPIMQRCMDQTAMAPDVLQPGATMRNNLNLTFGSGGFAFAEPGEFEIIPLLGFTVEDDTGERAELVIRGESLRIRVAHPHSLDEEQDAMTLFRTDVGAWFALGGSDCLSRAQDSLLEVCERRTAQLGAADPVAAAIVRTEGIHSGRPSVRYTDGRFTRADGDTGHAAELLSSLDDQALATFDAHTAEHTRRLAAAYRHRG